MLGYPRDRNPSELADQIFDPFYTTKEGGATFTLMLPAEPEAVAVAGF